MSEQHPTPQWFTPSGGTTTAPRYEGAGAPTTPMPYTSSTPPPPMGPRRPAGPARPAARAEAGQAPRRRPAHRRRGAGRPARLRWHRRRGPLLATQDAATPPPRPPARQQRRGPGQAGHRVGTRLDRHGVGRLAERRQHHRDPRPGRRRRAPASSSTSRATCSPTTTSSSGAAEAHRHPVRRSHLRRRGPRHRPVDRPGRHHGQERPSDLAPSPSATRTRSPSATRSWPSATRSALPAP